ncbi:hypothetical protein DF286_03980 [Sphingosinicella humi]|uniref:Uncharacterized protein n=2 Tax=Allosphingosinicella humi TaxID=2068657 RepID=A0A2U2J1A7_9SPHN|nr:hypothetical protein DF286_03980 [Sphingosinicella humi]
MRKVWLMTGIATAAVAFTSAANAQLDNGRVDINYANNIDTSVVTDVAFTKDVTLAGEIELDGDIDVNSAAVAVVDNKQLLIENAVTFREETQTGGFSETVDENSQGELNDGNPDTEGGVSGTIDDDADYFGDLDDDNDGVADNGESDVGHFSPIINVVGDLAVTNGDGNAGVNAAAGYYNQQENVAAIAASDFDASDAEEDSGGMAEASITAAQGSLGNYYGPNLEDTNEDEETFDPDNDFRDRNIAGSPNIGGNTGNLGVNVAAGAFNQQKNALAIASASNASMAEASAAVIQASLGNTVMAVDSQNLTGTATITNNTGNLGVNLAAGVGNQQINSLAIAFSSGGGDNGNGGNGGNGGGPQ